MRSLATAVALVVLAGCAGPAAGPEVAPPGVPSAPAPTGTTSSGAPGPAGLDALPRGASPRVGYVVGRRHVAPGGRGVRLPATPWPLAGVDAFDGGLLVDDGRYFEGTTGLSVVTADGTEALEPCTTSGVAAGDTVAWATFACPETGVPAPTLLHLRTADGETTQRLVDRPDRNVLTAVVGLLDGEVLFSRAFGTGGVYRSDLCGPPRRVPGLHSVTAVDETGGLLAGHTDLDGRRFVVLDAREGRALWRDRRWRAVDFDPSGRRLVGGGPRTGWSVRDARTGDELLRLAVPRGLRVGDVVWEDPRHLLAVVHERDRQALVRFGPDGSPRLTTPVLRPRPRATGYLLADPS